MLRIRKLLRCEIKVTTQKNQSAYLRKEERETKGEGGKRDLFLPKKLIKKKNTFLYMATYRVLTVLPQMRFM